MCNPWLFLRTEKIPEDSLKDVSVELQLAVSQELSNHLSAQALPLQQEVSYSDGCVWDETTRDQEVDASLWVPAHVTAEKQIALELTGFA